MLSLRPNCECCDRDLPPDSGDAMICTFECTFAPAVRKRSLAGLARIAAANWFGARCGPRQC